MLARSQLPSRLPPKKCLCLCDISQVTSFPNKHGLQFLVPRRVASSISAGLCLLDISQVASSQTSSASAAFRLVSAIFFQIQIQIRCAPNFTSMYNDIQDKSLAITSEERQLSDGYFSLSNVQCRCAVHYEVRTYVLRPLEGFTAQPPIPSTAQAKNAIFSKCSEKSKSLQNN
jgi:hypothetical protein